MSAQEGVVGLHSLPHVLAELLKGEFRSHDLVQGTPRCGKGLQVMGVVRVEPSSVLEAVECHNVCSCTVSGFRALLLPHPYWLEALLLQGLVHFTARYAVLCSSTCCLRVAVPEEVMDCVHVFTGPAD
eukprot:3018633-Rhodomonas_salina.1